MKERISLTINAALLKWIDDNVARRRFANRSHAFEFLLFHKKKLVENHAEVNLNFEQEDNLNNNLR